jgi:hypothetical protein
MFLPEPNNIDEAGVLFNPMPSVQIPFRELRPLGRRIRFGPS